MFRNQRLIKTNLTRNSTNGVGGYVPYCEIPQYGIGFQYIRYNQYPNGTWSYASPVAYALTSQLYVPSANTLAPTTVGTNIAIDSGTVQSNCLYILVTIDIQNINQLMIDINNAVGPLFYTRLHIPELNWKLYRV